MSKKLPKYLKIEEMRKLLKKPEKLRDRLILQILYKCGLRVSELSNLKIEDVDLEECRLKVVEGKGDKQRYVPFDTDVKHMIQLYLSDSIDADKREPLVTSTRGNAISTTQIYRMVRDYAKDAGLRHTTPHMLRHSYAVHSLQSGRNLRTVQKLLGHSSLTTTQIYLDITLEDIHDDCNEHPLPI